MGLLKERNYIIREIQKSAGLVIAVQSCLITFLAMVYGSGKLIFAGLVFTFVGICTVLFNQYKQLQNE